MAAGDRRGLWGDEFVIPERVLMEPPRRDFALLGLGLLSQGCTKREPLLVQQSESDKACTYPG